MAAFRPREILGSARREADISHCSMATTDGGPNSCNDRWALSSRCLRKWAWCSAALDQSWKTVCWPRFIGSAREAMISMIFWLEITRPETEAQCLYALPVLLT